MTQRQRRKILPADLGLAAIAESANDHLANSHCFHCAVGFLLLFCGIINQAAMITNSRGRSNWSKCKRAVATLFILLCTLVLARAQSIGASVKTWMEIKAADKAAVALAKPNATAKERLGVEQMYYQLVRDNPQSVPAQNALRHDLTAAWKIDSAELLQRALFQFREASRLAPMDLEYARAYAETFYGMPNPDWKEAQVAWQHYLELSTDRNRNFAYLQLARVSVRQRKKAQALSFLDKISDFSRPYSEVKEKLRKQAEAL